MPAPTVLFTLALNHKAIPVAEPAEPEAREPVAA
jgi:hypothetical protein